MPSSLTDRYVIFGSYSRNDDDFNADHAVAQILSEAASFAADGALEVRKEPDYQCGDTAIPLSSLNLTIAAPPRPVGWEEIPALTVCIIGTPGGIQRTAELLERLRSLPSVVRHIVELDARLKKHQAAVRTVARAIDPSKLF